MCRFNCHVHHECVYEREVDKEALSERYEKGRLVFESDCGIHEAKRPRKTSLVMQAVVDRLWLRQYGFSLKDVESLLETDDDDVRCSGWYVSCHGEIVSDSVDGRKSEWHKARGEDGLNCVDKG
jgi:hypothetical protein